MVAAVSRLNEDQERYRKNRADVVIQPSSIGHISKIMSSIAFLCHTSRERPDPRLLFLAFCFRFVAGITQRSAWMKMALSSYHKAYID
jgi:hypothetical protein